MLKEVLAAFLKRFGSPAPTEIGYAIPAPLQSALGNASAAGSIIGLLVSQPCIPTLSTR
jgi:hypothetical protein